MSAPSTHDKLLAPTVPSATDAPDPEFHEPPVRLDDPDQVALGQDAPPSSDFDPTALREGLDELRAEVPTRHEDEKRLAARRSYNAAIARAETRWPSASHVNREEWARAVAGMVTSIPSSGIGAFEARLDAAERTAKTEPKMDYGTAFTLAMQTWKFGERRDYGVVAHWMAKTDLATETEYEEALERLKAAHARVYPQDGVDEEIPSGIPEDAEPDEYAAEQADAMPDDDESEHSPVPVSEPVRVVPRDPWMDYVHDLFGMKESPPIPHARESAEEWVDRLFPGIPSARRELFVCALMARQTMMIGDDEVEFMRRDLEESLEETNNEQRQRQLIGEVVSSVLEAERLASPSAPTSGPRPPASDRNPIVVALVAAILLTVLAVSAIVTLDRRELARAEARRDTAASGLEIHDMSVPVQADERPPTRAVEGFEDLVARTGFSPDPVVREVEVLSEVNDLRYDVETLQLTESAASQNADRLASELRVSEDQRAQLEAERALDKEQLDKAVKSAGDAAGQAGSASLRAAAAEASARRAEEALRLSQAREAKTVLQTIKSGRCTRSPGDFIHPTRSGVWSQYNCGSAETPILALCDGRAPASATTCEPVQP